MRCMYVCTKMITMRSLRGAYSLSGLKRSVAGPIARCRDVWLLPTELFRAWRRCANGRMDGQDKLISEQGHGNDYHLEAAGLPATFSSQSDDGLSRDRYDE